MILCCRSQTTTRARGRTNRAPLCQINTRLRKNKYSLGKKTKPKNYMSMPCLSLSFFVCVCVCVCMYVCVCAGAKESKHCFCAVLRGGCLNKDCSEERRCVRMCVCMCVCVHAEASVCVCVCVCVAVWAHVCLLICVSTTPAPGLFLAFPYHV